jgi:hypothetical protein
MGDQTNFKPLQVTESSMPGDAHSATMRPEGSRKGRDKYQTPNKTSRNSDSKSFPRKNGK